MIRKLYHRLNDIPILGAILRHLVAIGYLVVHARAILEQFHAARVSFAPRTIAVRDSIVPAADETIDYVEESMKLRLAVGYMQHINTLVTKPVR